MAFVIKIANMIQKHADGKSDVKEYIESKIFYIQFLTFFLGLGESWTEFLNNELKASNELNSKNLGGQHPRPAVEEDDNDTNYEVNMEKIMARFSNFNSMSSASSVNNEDDDDDDDVEKGDANEEEADGHGN